MDIDPLDPAADAAGDTSPGDGSGLGTRVALTVALLATFLGVCKVKDDNIVQAMQQAQADRLDHWNFYQARNIRQDMAATAVLELRLAAAGAAGAQQEGYRAAIAAEEARVEEERAKKEELRAQADQDQKTYDALNYRDDQFDLSDTLIALAISLLAITALTKKPWLYWMALAPTLGGVAMGLAGLFGWRLHPDMLARLLS